MRPEHMFEPLSGHPLAFAARGFARSLTDEQRAAFIALFSGRGETRAALSAAVEQCEFERGEDPTVLPDPALMSALIYALPRESAAGGIVSDEIRRRWPGLDEKTREAVRVRIEVAVGEGRSGMKFDTVEWLRLARLPLNEAERGDLLKF